MIYMWFPGINYYKLAVQKDRDSIFTTITIIWKPGFRTNVEVSKGEYVIKSLKFVYNL
jgi:hypothetical protein